MKKVRRPPLSRAFAHANHIRWEKFCAYLGAGVGGLALFGDVGKDVLASAPYPARALFLTAVVTAGVFLGRAYFGYTEADYRLTREGDVHDEHSPTPEVIRKIADQAHTFFIAGFLTAGVAAGVFIYAAWVAPLG
ncbi:hypothetical protein LJR013_003208 [Pseudarthrobacter oxydans]|uniref:hypothetical protein n=1 Tax=Pseudarthrobacter oxydans TaxID=1671 RepID=UPI003ECDC81F